eukprot:4922336-Heterocapsa_arctica.AAC.1
MLEFLAVGGHALRRVGVVAGWERCRRDASWQEVYPSRVLAKWMNSFMESPHGLSMGVTPLPGTTLLLRRPGGTVEGEPEFQSPMWRRRPGSSASRIARCHLQSSCPCLRSAK